MGALERFGIEVGITYLNNEPLRKLKSLPFYIESYHLIIPRKTFNFKKETVSWVDVVELRLCLNTLDMQNRRILNQHFLKDGIFIIRTLEAKSLIALFTHIQTGGWSSILRLSLVNSLQFNQDIVSIPMAKPPAQHKISLIALDRDPNTLIITAFLKKAKALTFKDIEEHS